MLTNEKKKNFSKYLITKVRQIMLFKNKTILITGGGKGIGKSTNTYFIK